MRGSIEAQGITAEYLTLPGGLVKLSLTNASGHVLAASTFEADTITPDNSIDPRIVWETAPAA